MSIYTVASIDWQQIPEPQDLPAVTKALEDGQIVLLPNLHFQLSHSEQILLSPKFSNGKSKNISYNTSDDTLRGFKGTAHEQQQMFQFIQRYATQATSFIKKLLPNYSQALQIGRTSFRPIEVFGRSAASFKKDDSRLHVDAFPANPNQGRRILRIFTNINQEGKPRVWKVGEPFSTVAKKFINRVPKQFPFSGEILRLLGITKSKRSSYDHYMLHIHDKMKEDQQYQKNAEQQEIHLPAQSSWIVFTDQVSHAALSGQHVLEQTFYLPVNAMLEENKSPLRILEQLAQSRA